MMVVGLKNILFLFLVILLGALFRACLGEPLLLPYLSDYEMRQEEHERAYGKRHLIGLVLNHPVVLIVELVEHYQRRALRAHVEHVDHRAGQQHGQQNIEEQRNMTADNKQQRGTAEIL